MKGTFSVVLVASLLVISTLGRPEPARKDGKRLIKVNALEEGKWLSEDAIMELKRAGTNFFDITGRTFPTTKVVVNEDRIPTTIVHQTVTNNALSELNIDRARKFLEHFTSYFNRYYQHETGLESTLWLLSEIESSIADSKYSGKASVQTFEHDWLQPSIIARLAGSDPTLSSEVVILGGHLDSLNFFISRAAPGADDNGSGSTSLLEALRVLLYTGFIPKRTVEFHWYAAEEVGLRGSAAIAEQYNKDGVDIVSMMNFDVTGYNGGGPFVGINVDFVNDKLNNLLRLLVDQYLNYGWKNRTPCGYACSDHASFHELGYITAFPSEIALFPDMHTARDTIDRVSFEQILEFSKLAVGYAVELGQPNDA